MDCTYFQLHRTSFVDVVLVAQPIYSKFWKSAQHMMNAVSRSSTWHLRDEKCLRQLLMLSYKHVIQYKLTIDYLSMPFRHIFGNTIALILALPWTYASQAHFTGRFTPDLAARIDASVWTSQHAFSWTGLGNDEVGLCPYISDYKFEVGEIQSWYRSSTYSARWVF